MKTLLRLIVSLGLLASLQAAKEITGADHILKPLVGSQVIVEGLAWGEFDKGLGERITLPYGEHIYLVDLDFKKKDLNGRLVRVSGKLTIQKMKGVGTPEENGGLPIQGYTADFDYYQIDVSDCVVIEKVTLGYPKKKK
jgi:hypothetical protein